MAKIEIPVQTVCLGACRPRLPDPALLNPIHSLIYFSSSIVFYSISFFINHSNLFLSLFSSLTLPWTPRPRSLHPPFPPLLSSLLHHLLHLWFLTFALFLLLVSLFLMHLLPFSLIYSPSFLFFLLCYPSSSYSSSATSECSRRYEPSSSLRSAVTLPPIHRFHSPRL